MLLSCVSVYVLVSVPLIEDGTLSAFFFRNHKLRIIFRGFFWMFVVFRCTKTIFYKQKVIIMPFMDKTIIFVKYIDQSFSLSILTCSFWLSKQSFQIITHWSSWSRCRSILNRSIVSVFCVLKTIFSRHTFEYILYYVTWTLYDPLLDLFES